MSRRNITAKRSVAATEGAISLDGLTADEKEMYLSVIKASIPAMIAHSPGGAVERQERLFRAMSSNAIELAGIFVQEYRKSKKSVRSMSENE